MVDHAGSLLERRIMAFGQTMQDLPSDVFKERFWVSPFPEEDIPALAAVLGPDHVLMGSDWPPPEGTVTPGAYAGSLAGLDDRVIRGIMRDNALELINR